MPRIIVVLVLIGGLVLASAATVAAQVTYDPNQEKYALLSLNQSYIELGQAAKEFIRLKQQYDAKLISAKDFDQGLNNYKRAKISYDLALMRILTNASYVIVEKAIKRTTPSGQKVVDITLKNEVGGTFELAKLRAFGARDSQLAGGEWDKPQPGSAAPIADKLLNSEELASYEAAIKGTLPYLEGQGLAFSDVLNLLEINNIFVSLTAKAEGTDVVMISNPYEQKIPVLRQNERATVEFELLRDVESCNIVIQFGDKNITKPVYFKLESTAGGVELVSQIPSLQADLDSTGTFNLSMQRFSTGSTAFALRVANLPEQIDYNFIDPDNNNQLVSTVNFTEGAVRKNVQLQLTMPTRASERVIVDQPIKFQAFALSTDKIVEFDALVSQFGRDIPKDKIDALDAGMVELVVTPQGVGRVEVSASTFYYPIQPDEKVEMTITVKNTGTGELKNVQIKTDLPNNDWDYKIEPELIQSLTPEQQEKVKLSFAPPANATVGEHILKVKVEAKTRNRVIEADDKEVTVEIKEKPDIWGRLILIVLLIGIVLGIVIFGIKLSRR